MNKTLDNASPVLVFNRFLSESQILKYTVQGWLDTIQFGLHITIEPTPWSPMVDDEVRQRLRQVEMNINRRFIGNKFSSFKNWNDRFWYIGFFEGKGKSRHCHILLYIPYLLMKLSGGDDFKRWVVRQAFNTEWLAIPSTNYLGRRKDSSTPYIQTIEMKKNSVRCSRYDSKKLNNKDAYEDYFFSTM